MASLRKAADRWIARKRIPQELLADTTCSRGLPKSEFVFARTLQTPEVVVRREYIAWLQEKEALIEHCRAHLRGDRDNLNPSEARALAGAWYSWFKSRHSAAEEDDLQQMRATIRQSLIAAVGEGEYQLGNIDRASRRADVREQLRPTVAEVAETDQFLMTRPKPLTDTARALFLDHVFDDLAEALERLLSAGPGGYIADDPYERSLPKLGRRVEPNGLTPIQLCELWKAENKPARSTLEGWEPKLRKLTEAFPGRSAASLSQAEAEEWIASLQTPERSPRAVREWLRAVNAVFNFNVKTKRLQSNPFDNVYIHMPRRVVTRSNLAFFDDEARTVLFAANAIFDLSTPDERARRWVPWLCAYTGARPGEITQLRGSDVRFIDGIWAVVITPDAGTVKDRRERVVPLHEHLIEMGLIEFSKSYAAKPMFWYRPKEPEHRSKPPAAQAVNRLAAWVRGLGVTEVPRPNHAWRHTFVLIANRYEMRERHINAICGHKDAKIAARYGIPTLGDLAQELRRFPRYVIN